MSYDSDAQIQPAILPVFWMVWGDCCGSPTVKHESEFLAQKEARRLAGKHPGKIFYVLKTTSYHQGEIRMCSTNMETTKS